MKKMIYAVKCGRKTGIFDEWRKCSEQTDKFPKAKFRRFEYRSELEEEPEDVPGSLRYAMKRAEEFLADLKYLGESADYLEDESWEEDGFLRFGNEAEMQNIEFLVDWNAGEEDTSEEEFNQWIEANRKKNAKTKEYWEIAKDMNQCFAVIQYGKDMDAKTKAADSLRRQLGNCLAYAELNELTAVYKDKAEKNAIGYDPPSVAKFVKDFMNRYPKPKDIETKETDDESAREMEKEPPWEVTEEEEAEFDDPVQLFAIKAEAVESELRDRLVGQDVAIEKLSTAYFDNEFTNWLDPDRRGPKGVYLLAGPPGVGKTFMAEQFASKLGLDHERYEMSGYANKEAIEELVGFDPTWNRSERGKLVDYVADHPNCVLLFDEIEKAHITVIRLFLQILDNGICEDKHHKRKVSFKDTIIFFTTNAGRQLYQNARNENLTLLPEKVIIDALEKDRDVETKQPFFPPEILSRMSSYTVIMLNHLKASAIYELVERKLRNRLKKMKRLCRCQLDSGIEYLARTVLYSMGGSADARNAAKAAGKLINKEMFEFSKLVAENRDPDQKGGIARIEWKCNFDGATEEIKNFYFGERDCVIPVFGTVKYDPVGKIKNNNIIVKSTVDVNEFMEMFHKENVLFTVIDYRYGLEENVEGGENAADARSIGRDVFLKLREDHKEIPVYVLDGTRGYRYRDIEKRTLMVNGVGGFIESKYFKSQLEKAYLDVCCQTVMETLAVRHQVVTYKTKMKFDKEANAGTITFCDFKLETAVETEDKSTMLSDGLRPDKSWDDIYVSPALKDELGFFIDYLKNPKKYKGKYKEIGGRPKGILLYGPPGTGKTSLAKIVASESGLNFLSINASEFLNGGIEKVQKEFRIARKYAPAILFIDEIDAIGMKREYSNAPNPILNTLLTEMDGFKKVDDKPVFVMAATNRGHEIDFALQRRFDRTFEMPCLDKKGRRWQLKKLIEKQGEMFDISDEEMESILERSAGRSPAKLEQVIEAAVREAIRSGCIIDDDLLDEMFEKCIVGEETVAGPQEQIKRTAYHEAGHVLIDLYNGRSPTYMSIVARGEHKGYMLPGTGNGGSTKEYFLECICRCLGGRAAEMVFGYGLTYGPCGDLAHATEIVTDMVCKLGMYEKEIGLAVITKEELRHNEQAKQLINRILSEQLAEAISIIEANQDAVERLVKAVMENGKKYLTKHEIVEVAGQLNKK